MFAIGSWLSRALYGVEALDACGYPPKPSLNVAYGY
jgi:hypothetical protein